MTSKNSFLASMKENNKRRLSVWILSVISFVLIFPIYVSLIINRILSQTEYYVAEYGAAIGKEIVRGNLLEAMQHSLGTCTLLMGFTVIFAVCCAIQGFSWLYSRKKIDFYLGMPVKRRKRFLVIWLNGILIYLIPYLLGLLLAVLIAAGNHGINGTVLATVIQAFGLNLLLYLCVYHLAVFTVMLTGNVVITIMGFGVFCLYEAVVRYIDYAYRQLFFRYFSYYGFDTTPVFSPFGLYLKITDSWMEGGCLKYVGIMALFAVLFGALAYWGYLKRPAEGAGKAMIFGFTKPVVKIFIVVPMALLAGLVVVDAANYNPLRGTEGIGYVILAMVLTVVLGSCAIQAIYDFDIKGLLRRKSHIVISGVLAALAFLTYRYDLLHYDDYIPDPEKVESVAFIPGGYEMVGGYMGGWLDMEEGGMNENKYGEKYMFLTDVEDMCELAAVSMEKYNQLDLYSMERSDIETNDCWSHAIVIYRMKNGKEVVRDIAVNVEDEQTQELLDRLIGSKEFKEGYMPGASERLEELIDQGQYQVKAYYGNLVYQHRMSVEELKELLACYRKDMEAFSFLAVKDSVPVGAVSLELEKELSRNAFGGTYMRSSSIMELGMNIYPFFENSIACLKNMGYYADPQVNIEDIAQIQVINYNREAAERQREEQKTAAGAETIWADEAVAYNQTSVDTAETTVYVDYTDADQIEQIVSCIYPEELLGGRWDNGKSADNEYEVVVYFKPGSEIVKERGSSVYYCFIEGEVPEFVQEDTAYRQ